MNNEDLQVVLQAMLDIDETGKNIKAQLSTLKKILPDLELEIDANFNLDDLLKKFDKLKKTFSETTINGDWVKTTTKLKDNLGRTIDVVKQLNKLTGETDYKIISSIDLDKQNTSLTKQAELYKEIKSTLDSLPNQYKNSQTAQDYYSTLDVLDTSDSLDELKTLKTLTDSYYKEVISLEKEYQNVKQQQEKEYEKLKKENQKDTIEAFKQEESKVDYIYQKRKQLLELERQINTLSTTKGVDTNNYFADITGLRSQLDNYSVTGTNLYPEQKQEIKAIIDQLQEKLKLEKDNLAIIKQQEDIYSKIHKSLANLNDVTVKNDNYDANVYADLSKSFNDIDIAVKNGKMSFQDANIAINRLTPSVKDFEIEAKKASNTTNAFSDTFKRFLRYYSFYDILQLAKRGFRELVTEVKALDDSLLEVNKIINLSDSEMRKFVKTSYDMGDSISRTGRDMIDATANIVKSGINNLDEALQYGKIALSMKNVGEDMDNVENNANILISAMKGFGDESVQFAEKTLNILNSVSNSSAVTFADLAEGFSRTSAVFAQADVSIEQLAGLITGSNEIIQNIEKSSSGLLIISQRLRQVTSAFEEDPENLSRLDGALERIAGIDIQDATGQLRDTYSILTDIAKVYPTLTKNEKAYLGELIAGKRQISVFEALLANWDKVEKATATATNSAGSYQQEQEAYFESISGHLARLESSWQSLATKSLDSGFVKSVINATTSTVKLIDSVGGLQVVLLGLSSALILVNKSAVLGSINGLIEQMVSLATATTTATGATVALSLAQKLLIGGAIVGGVMAIGYAINKVANASKDAKQEVQTLSDELRTMKDTENNIKSLSKRYEELRKIQNKTTEQAEEYVDVQNKLKGLLPELSGYYNTLGDFQIAEKDNLKELISDYKEYIKLKRDEKAEAVKKSAKWTSFDYDTAKSDFERMKRLEQQYVDLQNQDKPLSEIEEQLKSLELHSRISFTNVGKEVEKARQKMQGFGTTMSDEIMNIVRASDEWEKLSSTQQDAISKAFSEQNLTIIEEYHDKIKDNKFATEEFLSTMGKTDSAKAFIDAINEIKNESDEATESILTLSEKISELSNIRSDIESLQKVLDNLSSSNLTAEDMEQLLSISEEFLPYLSDEVSLREKLNETIEESKNSYKSTYEYMMLLSSDTYSELSTKIEKYFNGLGIAYSDDLKNYKELETAKTVISNNLIKELSRRWGEYFSVGLNGIVQVDDSKANVSSRVLANQYKEAQAYVDGFYNLFNDIEIDPIDINFDTSSIKSSADKAISEVDRLKQELEKRLQDNEFEISLLEFSGGEDTLTKQIAVYQQMQDEVHDLAQKYRAMGLSENDDYIQQLRTQWMDYASTISSLEATSFDNSNKDIDRNITQLELEQQLLKENSQEYIDIENKKYNEIVKREQLLQAEISRLQAIGNAQAKERAEELIDVYYDTVSQRYSIIANLKSAQISIYNDQIDELERQKSALEDLHNFTMQMIKDELNAKKKSVQEEIKGIEEVFNRRKQALRDEQDTRNYNKGLTEKSSVVADLENQLALIKNDETAIAKRKQLEQELAKAKEDLANYQYDHSIELAEKALDEELEIQKSKLEEEIEELDDTLSNEVTMRELANKRIEKSGEKLKNQLIKHAKEYGTFTIEEVTNAWEVAGNAVDDFDKKQQTLLETLKQVTAELKKVEGMNVGEYSSSTGLSSLTASETRAKMMANSAKWLQADATTKDLLAQDNQRLGKSMGWYYDPVQGRWFYDKDKKLPVYHQGGIVGGYSTKSTEELALLAKKELVITPPQAQNIMDNITNNNSESFNPTFVFQFEGNTDSSLLEQFKREAKTFANIVVEEMDKARSNKGYKKKLKRA